MERGEMKYRVLVAGPDDVIDFDNEIEALRYANIINKVSLEDNAKHPAEQWVLCIATVSVVK
jgi:hypothetical protein